MPRRSTGRIDDVAIRPQRGRHAIEDDSVNPLPLRPLLGGAEGSSVPVEAARPDLVFADADPAGFREQARNRALSAPAGTRQDEKSRGGQTVLLILT
jgi:hypothetical protein